MPPSPDTLPRHAEVARLIMLARGMLTDLDSLAASHLDLAIDALQEADGARNPAGSIMRAPEQGRD